MTNFNPEGDFKDIETWEAIAENNAAKTGASVKLISGILLGGMGITMGVPALGGVAAAWLIKAAWDSLSTCGKRLRVVRDMGCNAWVLEEDNFKTYVRQFGDKTVLDELVHAKDAGCELTPTAHNWLRFHACALTPTQEVAAIDSDAYNGSESLKNREQPRATATAVIDRYDPLATTKIDIINEMSDRVSNTIVIGIPGSGKGMLISNAMREVKRKHPDLKVFVIDPKDDPKEAGYFHGCDVVLPYACMDAKPGTVAAWAESAFDEYAIYAQKNERTLLIVDEGTMLGNKLQQAKSTLLVDKLTSYTSGGDSAGRNVWFMMQSPYVTGASLNLSTTSQMTSIVIAFRENIGAFAQWKSAKIFKQLSLDAVSELIENSTTGRAVYYGKTGKWYMMPELKNYSGYDRDKREYLPGFSVQEIRTSNNASEKLEDSENAHADNESISNPQLSELAERILSFFDNAKNKEPKKLLDLKKKDELRERGDINLIMALTELVNTQHLIFDGEDSWLKPDW